MGFVYLILFALVLFIVFQNYETLSQGVWFRINLIFGEWETKDLPMGVWFIIVFAVGFILSYIRFVPYRVKFIAKSRELERLKKEIQPAEIEKTEIEKTEIEKTEIEKTEKTEGELKRKHENEPQQN
jgi:uncharacterized membrane protein YciS (DUF1049 family)